MIINIKYINIKNIPVHARDRLFEKPFSKTHSRIIKCNEKLCFDVKFTNTRVIYSGSAISRCLEFLVFLSPINYSPIINYPIDA